MQKKMRLTAFLLALVFCLPLFTLYGGLRVDAAEGERRFIFSGLVSSTETAYEAGNDICPELVLNTQETIFEAQELSPMSLGGTTNAIYISFETSNANVKGVAIRYTYTQNNSEIERIEQHVWTENVEKQALVLYTPHITQGLKRLAVEFLCDGIPHGTVKLLSLFDVSLYADENEAGEAALATVKKCAYNSATQTVDIVVQLSHEASVYYAGQSLELFALAPNEDPFLSNKTYVARAGVSLNDIHFSVPVNRVDQIYARYVIAAVNKEGMREPLCDPIYPDIATENTKKSYGFKGFHADALFPVIDSGADVEIVDVYLDKLESEQGILYAGAQSYYHFDQSYVAQLDHRIQNLTGAGCSVYLRFLISPNADEFSFVEGSAENILHKGIVIDSEEALLDIHAYTDFLVSRYTDRERGEIEGIIIGRQADRSSTYGYVGTRDLASYAQLYAVALNLIAGTARNHMPDMQIIVPVSDRRLPEVVSEKNLTGDYFSELFVTSLLEALKAQTLTPPEFSLMLESSALPKRVEEEASPSFYGTDGLSAFLATISESNKQYPFLDAQIFFSWAPDGKTADAELTAAYLLQYLTLQASGRVRSYFVDFTLLSATEQEDRVSKLLRLVTYIDTDRSGTAIQPILKQLGVSDIEQLVSGLQADALQKARVFQVSLQKGGYQASNAPIGSYELWNFSEATELFNWYAGISCTDLSVLNRFLTAQLSAPKSGEFADFAYHFPSAKNLSAAPLLKFSIGVNGTEGLPYEVQIRLLGKQVTAISSVVLTSGAAQELYLDLSEHAASLTNVSGIRILARPLGDDSSSFSVCLGSVTLESATLSTQELVSLISSDKTDVEAEGEQEGRQDLTTPILVTVLVVFASALLAAIVIVRHRRRKLSLEKPARQEAAARQKSNDNKRKE